MQNKSFKQLESAKRYIEQALRQYVSQPVDKEHIVNIVAKLLSETNIKADVRIDKEDPEVLAFKEEMNIRDDPDFIHISLSIPKPIPVLKLDFTL